MTTDITIRPMTPDDFVPLAEWMIALPLWIRYGVMTDRVLTNFRNGFANGDLMVTADGAIPCCGFAWAIPKGMFGRSAYLRLIGVHPDYASKGIGSQLLAHIEQSVQAYSPELFLLVADFNTDAQRFYQRHGYTQVGAIDGYVIPSVVELLFWRRLRP